MGDIGFQLGFIIICLVIAGICIAVSKWADSSGAATMGEENWKNFQIAVKEEELKKKYNNYMYTCPVCQSKNVKKISDLNRATSIAVWGVASNKIGKQYECDNCHHKW